MRQELEEEYPAFYGLAVVEQMIVDVRQAGLPPPRFAAWLHAIAQHVEHTGLEMPSVPDDDDDEG